MDLEATRQMTARFEAAKAQQTIKLGESSQPERKIDSARAKLRGTRKAKRK